MQLLHKTIVTYFGFSAILMLLAIPVFYLALKAVMIDKVDADLVAMKTRIIPQLRGAVAIHDQGSLSISDYGIAFEKEQPNQNGDSIYSHNELLPSRLLSAHVTVNQEFYRLQITTSLTDKMALVKRIVLVLTALLLLLLLGLLLINRILTKKLWRPFYITLQRLKDYRVDKQPVLRSEQASINEFNDLNKAIELLTERNYQTYASQKEFTENASHEMQSPLAVFQSKLELLMQTRPLTEDQAALITDLADASKRMSRLNKSLILLTRLENDQFFEKEILSLRDILGKLLQQYDFQLRQLSIHVSYADTIDIPLEANRTLIEILLSNLLSNAIRHNIPNGSINILLKTKELVVQNSGRPSALDPKRLFLRFQKESTDSGSLGLGLEIVKKICTLNHYTIEYRFIDALHTFSIRF